MSLDHNNSFRAEVGPAGRGCSLSKPDYIVNSDGHKSREHPGKIIKECFLAQISIQIFPRCKHVLEHSLEASSSLFSSLLETVYGLSGTRGRFKG